MAKRKLNPNRQVTLKVREIEKIKQNATIRAVKITQLFPLMVLRDKHKFGEARLKRFKEDMDELFDAYDKGYVTLADLAEVLHEEGNVKIDA